MNNKTLEPAFTEVDKGTDFVLRRLSNQDLKGYECSLLFMLSGDYKKAHNPPSDCKKCEYTKICPAEIYDHKTIKLFIFPEIIGSDRVLTTKYTLKKDLKFENGKWIIKE